jgi:hypothetical protein
MWSVIDFRFWAKIEVDTWSESLEVGHVLGYLKLYQALNANQASILVEKG